MHPVNGLQQEVHVIVGGDVPENVYLLSETLYTQTKHIALVNIRTELKRTSLVY